MDEPGAKRVVEALRGYGVVAHVERAGVYQFGVRVRVDDDRVAVWDTDGTAALEAQIMRNGMLVGFVPTIPGSESFTEAQVVHAIATTDYNAPVPLRSPPPSASGQSSGRTSGQAPAQQAARDASRPAGRTAPVRTSSTSGLLGRLFGRNRP